MEAARVCALRGHDVELFDQGEELGGAFLAAAAPDFKEDDKKLLQWFKKQLQDLKVTVKLRQRATKELLQKGRYDEIFAATGAVERRLCIPGLEHPQVYYAKEALLMDELPGQRVLIIGGGLTGCELAYDLGKKGKDITLIEFCDNILNVYGVSAANYNMLMELMDFYKVKVMKNTSLLEFDGSHARICRIIKNNPNSANRAKAQIAYSVQGMEKEYCIPIDTIVISVGYNSEQELYNEIKGEHVHLLGDAGRPGNVMSAVWEAYEIGRKV